MFNNIGYKFNYQWPEIRPKKQMWQCFKKSNSRESIVIFWNKSERVEIGSTCNRTLLENAVLIALTVCFAVPQAWPWRRRRRVHPFLTVEKIHAYLPQARMIKRDSIQPLLAWSTMVLILLLLTGASPGVPDMASGISTTRAPCRGSLPEFGAK